MNEENKKLAKSIDDLAKNIAQLNSLKRTFVRGIFMGVGSAIGVSIIAAILLAAINQLAKSIGVPAPSGIQNQLQEK